MNILYFIPNILIAGGIFRIVADKINYLAENTSWNLYLVYYGNGHEKPIYSLHPKVQLIPICIDWEVGPLKKIWLLFKNTITVRNLLVKNKIDIAINANAPLLIWILPFICKKTKKIHEFHFSYKGQLVIDNEVFKTKFKKFFIMNLRKICLSKFDKVVALTEYDKKMWSLSNIVVIPNFSNIQKKEGKFRKNKIAISVGRLEPQKGYERLISAWAIVAQKYPDWQLDIWGEGSLRNSLQSQINKFSLNSVVHLQGMSHNIGEIYAQSQFFVMSSLYEGFPLVLVEAMNCGLPCISFDIPGANCIIEHEKNGLLVLDNDVKTLANACIKLIENNVLLNKLGSQVYTSSKKYSKSIVMKKWLNLFSEMILS